MQAPPPLDSVVVPALLSPVLGLLQDHPLPLLDAPAAGGGARAPRTEARPETVDRTCVYTGSSKK